MSIITSPQNQYVKLVNSLQSRARVRRKERKIVLDGARLVRDAWQTGNTPEFVMHTPDAIPDAHLIEELSAQRVRVFEVDEAVMRAMSETKSPQGIIGVFEMPMPDLPEDLARVLILDGVADPGNMGTIIRSASGAGVDVVVMAPGCVDAYNPKSLRSGAGAHFRVPVVDMTWEAIEREIAVDVVLLADAAGEQTYSQVDWAGQRWALIAGSEAHGPGERARQLATMPVRIPMANATESLNVATATTVLLFEAARQRLASAI